MEWQNRIRELREEVFELEEWRELKVRDIVVYTSNPRSIGKIVKIIRTEKYYYRDQILPNLFYTAEVSCLSGKTNYYSIYRLKTIDSVIERLEEKIHQLKLKKLAARLDL